MQRHQFRQRTHHATHQQHRRHAATSASSAAHPTSQSDAPVQGVRGCIIYRASSSHVVCACNACTGRKKRCCQAQRTAKCSCPSPTWRAASPKSPRRRPPLPARRHPPASALPPLHSARRLTRWRPLPSNSSHAHGGQGGWRTQCCWRDTVSHHAQGHAAVRGRHPRHWWQEHGPEANGTWRLACAAYGDVAAGQPGRGQPAACGQVCTQECG